MGRGVRGRVLAHLRLRRPHPAADPHAVAADEAAAREPSPRLPMMRVFARLPAKVSAVVTKHLYTRSTQPLLLQMTTHQLRLLADAAEADPAAPEPVRNLAPLADEAEARLKAYTNPARGQGRRPRGRGGPAGRAVRRGGAGPCRRSPRGGSRCRRTRRSAAAPPRRPRPRPRSNRRGWRGRRNWSATQLVNYLRQFFIQLRSLMLSVLVARRCCCWPRRVPVPPGAPAARVPARAGGAGVGR